MSTDDQQQAEATTDEDEDQQRDVEAEYYRVQRSSEVFAGHGYDDQ